MSQRYETFAISFSILYRICQVKAKPPTSVGGFLCFFLSQRNQTAVQDHENVEPFHHKCLAGGYKCGNITYEIQNNLKI